MEIIEFSPRKQKLSTPRPTTYPGNNKVSRRYVQPPRMQSFAPQQKYSPPKNLLDGRTTYHLSYLNVDRISRPKPSRPTQHLDISCGKFSDDTTTKLSYKPNWSFIKTKPIKPPARQITNQEPVEYITTAKHDFVEKFVPKSDIILPCGNIRISSGSLEGVTTAQLSYLNPGSVQPVASFKPRGTYCRSTEPAAKDTTQKLSFQSFCLPEKEFYPWAQKSVYRPPQTSMEDQTTYGKSFMEINLSMKEKPIIPIPTRFLPSGGQFAEKTIYNETFQPHSSEPVIPIIPCGNISLSDKQMASDTTSKLSYQPVQTKKREPILPRRRNMMGDGPMQSETTTGHDFVPKDISRPDVMIPCNNIHITDKPFEGKTTTSLSYMYPGQIIPATSFKPVTKYNRPDAKVEGETINKLSFQPWDIKPKEEFPWARKGQYQPPKNRMLGDTMYNMSYPAPGYYIEEPEESSSTSTNQGDNRKEVFAN